MILTNKEILFKRTKPLTYDVFVRKHGIMPAFKNSLKDNGVNYKLKSILSIKEAQYNFYKDDDDSAKTTHILTFEEETDEAIFLFHFSKNTCGKFPNLAKDMYDALNDFEERFKSRKTIVGQMHDIFEYK